MDPSSSTSGDVSAQPAVFLSHSGTQKDFVELLNYHLKKAQLTTFFDKVTIPKGSHFPSEISSALSGCKIGVVLLSDEYLSTKWPMLELGWLFSKGKLILPLFYGITVEDLKCTDNLSTWKKKWINMVCRKEVTEEQKEPWEEAVNKLLSIDRVDYQGHEDAYIEDVVTTICTHVLPDVAYDLSYVQGSQLLAKGIEGYFDVCVADSRHCGKAHMVALHGIAGSGKTILCKIMANHYSSTYLGRSCLIEFPTKYDELEVVEACKEALERLTYGQSNISGVTSFDKVVNLMKKHLSELNLFLAIDNVWESSVEAVRRLLRIGFTADSKVLLTSGSEAVLKELIAYDTSNNWYIGSLPALEQTDAFQIFEESLNRGRITSLVSKGEIENLLNGCMHEGKYHPLTVKELGYHVKSSLGAGDSKMDRNGFSRVLGEIGDKIDLEAVTKGIKPNYDGLEQRQKHMFLDIALWIPSQSGLHTHANARQWLCGRYEETRLNIDAAIYDLAMAGLIQIKKAEDGQEMIHVHDLYMGLAQKEAAKSSRFLMTSKRS